MPQPRKRHIDLEQRATIRQQNITPEAIGNARRAANTISAALKGRGINNQPAATKEVCRALTLGTLTALGDRQHPGWALNLYLTLPGGHKEVIHIKAANQTPPTKNTQDSDNTDNTADAPPRISMSKFTRELIQARQLNPRRLIVAADRAATILHTLKVRDILFDPHSTQDSVVESAAWVRADVGDSSMIVLLPNATQHASTWEARYNNRLF